MSRKPHVTRTFAPLHFEDLEPHRFEDLVRGLMHDYRDWQRIEATGGGGSDDGFDIRAYERALNDAIRDSDGDDDEEQPLTVEGNLWMIQCKREKQLSAARITSIISEAVNKDAPPYGYVLAAPVRFTKRSYDAFRAALVERGVSEFQLLGRAELEDMLYQPKNDRLLFAFFGISLTSRRRSRVTNIRNVVNIKNRLYKIFDEGAGGSRQFRKSVLIRDTNDEHYPYADKYPDFQTQPRWQENVAFAYHVEGIKFHVRRHYAYVDLQRKQWDFFRPLNLVRPQVSNPDDAIRAREARPDNEDHIRDFWEHLPLWHQAEAVIDGLLPYSFIDLVDGEGDVEYRMPHFFVEFGKHGPFAGYWQFLTRHENEEVVVDAFERVSIFPEKFPEPRYGNIYKDQELPIPSYIWHRLRSEQQCIFDFGNRFGFLRPRDVIRVPNPETRNTENSYVEVIHRLEGSVSEVMALDGRFEFEMQQQLGRRPDPDEPLTLLQLKTVYEFMLDRGTTPI